MQQLPRTIINPAIGDAVTFLQTAGETGGSHALVEVQLSPGGGTGLHYHLDYTEAFEAVDGVLGIQLGKETIFLAPGEQATVPLKAVHRFFNPGAEAIRFRVKISPARQFEQMLRIAYGLTRDGRVNKKGVPKSIWHLALLFEIGETYLPGMPIGLQKGIFGLLAKLAKRLGKHKELEQYYKGRIAPAEQQSFSTEKSLQTA